MRGQIRGVQNNKLIASNGPAGLYIVGLKFIHLGHFKGFLLSDVLA